MTIRMPSRTSRKCAAPTTEGEETEATTSLSQTAEVVQGGVSAVGEALWPTPRVTPQV